MATISINSNISALKAQRQLDQSTSRAQSAFQRLSSGQRINKASDDAAGLSIASALEKDVRVYTQALRNGNDAISALSVSGDTLQQLSSVVTRLKELATQSANGSLGRTQRLSLQAEGESLTDEFNRLIAVTSFNGVKLLDGTLSALGIQLGYGTNGQISVGFGSGIRRNLGTGLSSSVSSFGNEDATNADEVSGDFNGDGLLDIAVADSSLINLGIQIYLNNGAGGFTNSTISLGAGVNSLVAADFNGDGITDLAAANGGTLYTVTGRGNGTFNAATTTATTGLGGTLQAGDINGDGKADLVGITGTNSTISVFLGNGTGSFSAGTSTSSTNTATDIKLADMNGDGKLDIVTNDTVGRFIVTRLGSGNGTFGTAQTATSLNAPGRISIADFNSDGLLDVATLRGTGTQLGVHLGTGDGNLATAATIAVTGTYLELETGDMDGDGIPDLVISSNAGSIGIAKGRGDGTFDRVTSHTSLSMNGNNLLLGDFNNDGVNDVVNSSILVGYLVLGLSTTTTGSTLQYTNLSSREGALDALSILDAALARIQREVGVIGSSQSRILAALETLHARRENSAAAAGRIMNADIAQESADMVRERILQQTATAVLGQANQGPALALQLLNLGQGEP